MRCWFFIFALKLIGVAGLIISVILIVISIYGLLSEETRSQWIGVIIGIPSVALFFYAIRLLKLRNFAAEDINRKHSGNKE